MRWEWVESFLATARTGSLAQAAERLHMTQPGVGKHIRRLELTLGVGLFERSARGMTLTPAGRMVYHRLEALWEQWADLQAELRANTTNQPLRIGSLPTVSAYYLPQRMKALRKEFSREVLLHIRHTSREILAAFQEGQVDVAILDRSFLPDGIAYTPLFEEPFVVVLPSDHPLHSRSVLTLRDLAEGSWITYRPTCEIRQMVMASCEAQGVRWTTAMELAHGESIVAQVEAGNGIGVVPESLVAHQPHAGVVARPLQGVKPREIVLVTRSAKLEQRIYSCLVQGDEEAEVEIDPLSGTPVS